jgi:hypothetical protein
MLNQMGLGFVFTAHDLASNAFSNLERNFMSLDKKVGLGTERLQSNFQQLGTGLAVFTAGAAMVGGAFALANVAGQFVPPSCSNCETPPSKRGSRPSIPRRKPRWACVNSPRRASTLRNPSSC